MPYVKEIVVNGSTFSYNFYLERSEYETIVIYKNGVISCDFLDISLDDLRVVTQDIVDYIKTEYPPKFLFSANTEEIFNLYKEFNTQLEDRYLIRERTSNFPVTQYICLYDRI